MDQECVNGGGEHTVVTTKTSLVLEQPHLLSESICKVLNLWQARNGDAISVQDCEQRWFRARINNLDTLEATLTPFESIERPESALEVCVYQALPNKERFELVLQKLTEIGVSHIVPFVSNHSSTLEERDAGQKKSHRWPDVVLRAARQCRRGCLPQLYSVQSWDDVLQQLGNWDIKIILDAKGGLWSISEAINGAQPGSVAIVVGPEGGFDDDEIVQAQQQGAVPVKIGPRILRTESAAIVAAALVQHLAGDYV